MIAASRLEGPWQRAIHEFKYRPRPHLAAALAGPLAAAVTAERLGLEALTFVPLHPSRLRQRGFNQSERLARAVARRLDCRLDGGLRRVRATEPQVGLDQAARRANMAGAFQWEGPPPDGRLGLVDDVYTTGATIEAAVAGLEASGGQLAAILVLAVREGAGVPAAQTLSPAVVAYQG
jgi:predicted amidophosphoribosyltransferase